MDIRNFFSRKRKNSDNDGDTVGPAKKRRKLSVKQVKETKETKKPKEIIKENDVVPSIESLEIKQKNENNDNEEEKCLSQRNDEQFDEDECIDDNHESDDDDDINHSKKPKRKTNSNHNTETTILSKIKKESLKESCSYSVISECNFSSSSLIEYKIVSSIFEQISSTTKRLEKTEILSRLFRSILVLRPSELLYAIYLCCNEIAPPYVGIELGVGDTVILKALCESTGRKLRDIKCDYTKCGDLGDVAVTCRSSQNTLFKPKALTIKNVYETFKEIASTKGTKSQQEKVRNIQRLFVAATNIESRYIVRHLQGKLRIGVNEQTVLSALGRALAFNELKIGIDDEENNKNKINYQQLSDLENKYTA
eukprot:305420_1